MFRYQHGSVTCALSGNYDRQTDRPSDQLKDSRGHRKVTLPTMIFYLSSFQYIQQLNITDRPTDRPTDGHLMVHREVLSITLLAQVCEATALSLSGTKWFELLSVLDRVWIIMCRKIGEQAYRAGRGGGVCDCKFRDAQTTDAFVCLSVRSLSE